MRSKVTCLLQVTLSDIPLADRARQKMILLARKRYNSTTDELTLIGNKCPTRRQNKEYVLYLLKVLYIEANVSDLSNNYKFIVLILFVEI